MLVENTGSSCLQNDDFMAGGVRICIYIEAIAHFAQASGSELSLADNSCLDPDDIST